MEDFHLRTFSATWCALKVKHGAAPTSQMPINQLTRPREMCVRQQCAALKPAAK